ncbi:hypothetical protein [Nocardiopsis deserti]|uniref:hypothetical protein n=1 Tax=Nocardiopsis deserti TaxID=2605988 RepID=UPI001239D867|nr:hypothetical protein [Nocardiopsis deserti]
MSLPDLVLTLAAATVRPATCDPEPAPAPRPYQVVPVQARRRREDPHVDLIERDHPRWSVHAQTTTGHGRVYVAAHAGQVLRAPSPEELRHRIREAETAPPPDLVRPYLP